MNYYSIYIELYIFFSIGCLMLSKYNSQIFFNRQYLYIYLFFTDLRCTVSSQVPYTLQAFWGVSIRELHHFLWKAWSSFQTAVQDDSLLRGHYQHCGLTFQYPLFKQNHSFFFYKSISVNYVLIYSAILYSNHLILET